MGKGSKWRQREPSDHDVGLTPAEGETEGRLYMKNYGLQCCSKKYVARPMGSTRAKVTPSGVLNVTGMGPPYCPLCAQASAGSSLPEVWLWWMVGPEG